MTNTTLPPFSMGVEEEYLLVDLGTRELAHRPAGFFDACRAALGSRVAREFYRAQIEVGTRIHASPSDVRDELTELRDTVSSIAARYGVGIIAASMHPFARQLEQQVTPRQRYEAIRNDLAMAGRRLLVCGMHVHVGVEDDDERIDLMNQMRYFVPHLLTLSTSSPFFEGDDTGMNGYRLTLYQECPRTGLPPRFASHAHYRSAVDTLVAAGAIENATKIWWDLRPSDRYPTLEIRAMDMCTRVEDAVSLAALYGCLMRRLKRMRRANQRWREHSDLLLMENRWRAMRYGVKDSLFDLARGELVPVSELVEDLIELVKDEAVELGCVSEIAHIRRIVAVGTSADHQRGVYDAALAQGLDHDAGLRAVVDHLLAETSGRRESFDPHTRLTAPRDGAAETAIPPGQVQ